MSPALAGGFLTNGPPGKSWTELLTSIFASYFSYLIECFGHRHAQKIFVELINNMRVK